MRNLPYKVYHHKRKKKTKNFKYLGLYATRRRQFVKYIHGHTKAEKIFESLFKYEYKNFLAVEFPQKRVIEKVIKKNKNLNILRDYFWIYRREKFIKNSYGLLLNLKILLQNFPGVLLKVFFGCAFFSLFFLNESADWKLKQLNLNKIPW